MEVEESGSEEEEEKPTGVKRRSQRKDGEESDVGEVGARISIKIMFVTCNLFIK